MSEGFSSSAEIRKAFAQHDERVILNNIKVGCVIGIVLMPAGYFMDLYKYGSMAGDFLRFRLMSALLIAFFFGVLLTPSGRRHYRLVGMTLLAVPASFIGAMIYSTHDAGSPYYAGLNVVLLVLAFVLHWTFRESLLAAALVISVYLAASLPNQPSRVIGEFVNNLFFLGCTAVVAVTGTFFHNRSRFREFALRYELDRNRQVLEENNAKLRELDEIKNRFFANISHELRTPLTLLIAPLETLLRRRDLDSESKDLLATMHANGLRLLKLINDLLDLVRLESGRMETKLEPVDMTEFIKAITSAARQVANDKQLRLESFVGADLGTVLVDRDKLDKIVLNLVFNALKFTPEGGRVELRAEQKGGRFLLSVSDTGMGIAEKNLPHVFDRFWQADGSAKRKYQGMGIGLALVKELAQIQGGEVTVQSQEGKGTTFTVGLPHRPAQPAVLPAPEANPNGAPIEAGQAGIASEEWLVNLYRRAELFPALTPVQQSQPPPGPSTNGGRPVVLIADDEPDMLSFLRSQLSSQYNVLEAVDGQQAVEKASQFLPDLILLDMMMPEKDGLQACREIREQTPTQNIPVVLLTARADEETKLKALEAGASDFLAKPFSTTELHVRIRNLVESHRYQRKVSRQNLVLESTIEQLKETETQLVQTEKLASLGRMSAGIIHEINNPLNFATTGLFTLRNKGKYVAPEQQEEYHDILKDVEEGIKRVKNIISDLRMFTHPETASRDQVEVAETVAAALRFLSSEWKGKVRIEQDLSGHQTIWANRNRLIQVLVNLLQNSLDALQTKSFVNEQPTIWIQGRQEAGKSILVVRDNGSGIEPEHLAKVFDPFFTTKEIGKGMGLGLSICYRIVQEYEGRITVRSEPGRFCEFTLEFPAKG
ncbi:MAG TPA: ATP-binding protein [Candidatus Acidoferrum sp.]|nr:ATP-binding protein [Candidatus Acidoferrum sp.]